MSLACRLISCYLFKASSETCRAFKKTSLTFSGKLPFVYIIYLENQRVSSIQFKIKLFWEITAVIWRNLFRILLSWLHPTWSCWWFRGFCLYFRCRNWLHSFDLFTTNTAFIDLTEFIKKFREKTFWLKGWAVMNRIIIII